MLINIYTGKSYKTYDIKVFNNVFVYVNYSTQIHQIYICANNKDKQTIDVLLNGNISRARNARLMCNAINESIKRYCIIFVDDCRYHNSCYFELFCSVAKVIIHATSLDPRPLIVLLETNLFESVVNGVLVDLIYKLIIIEEMTTGQPT